jgi:hypothetical protein
MKLKLNEDGQVVLTDGHPTYLNEQGADVIADYSKAFSTIETLTLNAEKATTDAVAHVNALTTLQQKHDALEAANAEAKAEDKPASDKPNQALLDLQASNQSLSDANKDLNEKVLAAAKVKSANDLNDIFSNSKVASERLHIPTDMTKALFASKFSQDDSGSFYVANADGSKLMSQSNAGQVATSEECISHLIDNYAHKDSILKGSNSSGSGTTGGQGQQGTQKLSALQMIANSL